MDASVQTGCQKCSFVTTALNQYSSCGHRTCVECFEPEETPLWDGLSGNANCPICQRQILFQRPRSDQPFPPYFRRFDIIQNLQERQGQTLCDECSEDNLRAAGLSDCLDCKVHLCCQCEITHRQKPGRHRIFTQSELRDGNIFDGYRLIPKDDATLCSRHPGTHVSLWCHHCECAICRQCERYHDGHCVAQLAPRLSQMEAEVVKLKKTIEKFVFNFKQMRQKHEKKKERVYEHFESLTASIRSAAEERKKAIEEDALKLLKEVSKIKEDYESKCKMVEETIETEQVATHAWTKIMDSIFQDGGDLADDKLIDCFQFLKANENLIQEQIDTIEEIAQSVPLLSEIKNCNFMANSKTFDSNAKNFVGAIDTPILMLIGEIAEETSGVWVLVGDRGHHPSHRRKHLVIPHFMSLSSNDCPVDIQAQKRSARRPNLNIFSTIT